MHIYGCHKLSEGGEGARAPPRPSRLTRDDFAWPSHVLPTNRQIKGDRRARRASHLRASAAPGLWKAINTDQRGRRSPPSAHRRATSVSRHRSVTKQKFSNTNVANGSRLLQTPPPLFLTRTLWSTCQQKIFKHTNRPSLAVTSTSLIALCDSQRRTNVLTRHSDLPYRFFHMGDNANMSRHARPSLPGNEPVRPHHPLPHTIKDSVKIASSSFRVQHPKQQHGYW